jgi:hypothetical protein
MWVALYIRWEWDMLRSYVENVRYRESIGLAREIAPLTYLMINFWCLQAALKRSNYSKQGRSISSEQKFTLMHLKDANWTLACRPRDGRFVQGMPAGERSSALATAYNISSFYDVMSWDVFPVRLWLFYFMSALFRLYYNSPTGLWINPYHLHGLLTLQVSYS